MEGSLGVDGLLDTAQVSARMESIQLAVARNNVELRALQSGVQTALRELDALRLQVQDDLAGFGSVLAAMRKTLENAPPLTDPDIIRVVDRLVQRLHEGVAPVAGEMSSQADPDQAEEQADDLQADGNTFWRTADQADELAGSDLQLDGNALWQRAARSSQAETARDLE